MADGRTTATPGPAPDDPALLDQIKDETDRAQTTTRANDPEDGGHGINPRTVQAKLRSTQAATTTAIGAGFEFTPEGVELQLKHCQHMINGLQLDLQDARQAMEGAYAPAYDDASVAQADAVGNMFQNTVNVIQADIAYVMNWQNKLNAAKQRYMTTERLNVQQWTRLVQGLRA